MSGCPAPKPPSNPKDFESQTPAFSETDGPTVRVITYRAPEPKLGQCVGKDYELTHESCASGEVKQPTVLDGPKALSKGSFRYFSKVTSIKSGASATVGGSGGKAAYAVSNHQLVIEWSRYTVSSFSETKKADRSKSYVSAVERGIAIRVVFEVALRDASAETTLSFGFGNLAAALVAGKAEVQVRYDTIGIDRDILPPNAPINVTSINDLVNVQAAFYKAISDVSTKWNDPTQPPPPAPFTPGVLAYYVTKGADLSQDTVQQQQKFLEALKSQIEVRHFILQR